MLVFNQKPFKVYVKVAVNALCVFICSSKCMQLQMRAQHCLVPQAAHCARPACIDMAGRGHAARAALARGACLLRLLPRPGAPRRRAGRRARRGARAEAAAARRRPRVGERVRATPSIGRASEGDSLEWESEGERVRTPNLL